jgi:NAD(P)-dependent dehydrogenase (short-subunit alcohol dehydrogenase family)
VESSNEVESYFSVRGRVAIVTGALGLLGREHCHALAAADAHVVVADLDHDRSAAFAKEIGGLGMGVDITSKSSLELARDAILEKYERIDILINNAAINDMFENPMAAKELSMFENYPLELWQKSLDVNVTGTFLASQVFGSVMAEQGKGSIVNIASTYGVVAPDQSLYKKEDGSQDFYKSPAYPTTKGAVISFTRFLAAYWGNKGVRVNSLSPGGVENRQDEYFVKNYASRTPLGRMAAPSDYRGAILFLASDASAYMTGANLIVDGGWTAW